MWWMPVFHSILIAWINLDQLLFQLLQIGISPPAQVEKRRAVDLVFGWYCARHEPSLISGKKAFVGIAHPISKVVVVVGIHAVEILEEQNETWNFKQICKNQMMNHYYVVY